MSDPSPLRQHAPRIEAGRGDILERLMRHADIAAGLLDTPYDMRGAAWHAEAEGVFRTLARIAREVRDGG